MTEDWLSSADPWRIPQIGTLQIVLKIMERCNINCSYCYYFNMGDRTANARPARMSVEVAEQYARWLADGCHELGIGQVSISFHGGEPMMIRARTFDRFCEIFRRAIEPVAKLRLTIQTNGTILDDAWIEVFARHGVHVGVSIDGMRDANDRFRLDHRGKSTFDIIDANLARLVDSERRGAITLSTISVMDWRNSYAAVYAYLRVRGISAMSFLLPDRSRDQPFDSGETAEAYGVAMSDLFLAWLREDNQGVRIRQVENTLRHFQVYIAAAAAQSRVDVNYREFQILVLQSDGSVAVNDSYIPALSWYGELPRFMSSQMSLPKVLQEPVFRKIDRLNRTLPDDCRACEWRGLCKGGDIENRFSQHTGFNNCSIYCASYKRWYSEMVDALAANGYPAEMLAAQLFEANRSVDIAYLC